MADKLEYMPWLHHRFILDDRVQTELTDNMKWWYMRLLAHQWDHGVVPLDGNACACIVNPHISVRRKEWVEFTEKLPTFFPPLDEYQGQNATLEQVRARIVEAATVRTEKAKHAASTRWAKQRALLEQSPSNTQAHAQGHAPDAKGKGEGEGEGETRVVKSDAGASTDSQKLQLREYMGLIREHWQPTADEMKTNGSILKTWLGKGRPSPELPAAIVGLPLVIPSDARPTMKWLYAKDSATDMLKKAIDAHYAAEKGPPRKRDPYAETDDAQHLGEAMEKWA